MRGFPVCPASCIFIGKERKAVKMNGATITAVVLIAVILFFAVRYIYKEKKKGKRYLDLSAWNINILIANIIIVQNPMYDINPIV